MISALEFVRHTVTYYSGARGGAWHCYTRSILAHAGQDAASFHDAGVMIHALCFLPASRTLNPAHNYFFLLVCLIRWWCSIIPNFLLRRCITPLFSLSLPPTPPRFPGAGRIAARPAGEPRQPRRRRAGRESGGARAGRRLQHQPRRPQARLGARPAGGELPPRSGDGPRCYRRTSLVLFVGWTEMRLSFLHFDFCLLFFVREADHPGKGGSNPTGDRARRSFKASHPPFRRNRQRFFLKVAGVCVLYHVMKAPLF